MAGIIEDGLYKTNIQQRHARGNRFRIFYFMALIVAILALLILAANIVNQSAGLVALNYEVRPEDLSERPLSELAPAELTAILLERTPRKMLVYIRDNLSAVAPEQFAQIPVEQAIKGTLPETFQGRTIVELTAEEQAQILSDNASSETLITIIETEILKPEILQSWHALQSLTNRTEIENQIEDKYPASEYPNIEIDWRFWVNSDFISSPLSSTPGLAGIMPGLLGSMWIIVITASVAFPLGVGAAIYLNEYAGKSLINRIIEVNIRNLAGVPSILYGMLGLAIFVRALGTITQGRTIISAALTLALLILPIIIINAQEALRAVPNTIREGSYGLGATKWQTISRQVLPAALPGILTGTILAISRAIGETAPLIVVGAAAFINTNPTDPFSRFTAMPILIYNWTSQPNDQFRNIAAAGIIVLLLLLLGMNSIAIILRNRASRKV